jgi:hypothetical protein
VPLVAAGEDGVIFLSEMPEVRVQLYEPFIRQQVDYSLRLSHPGTATEA